MSDLPVLSLFLTPALRSWMLAQLVSNEESTELKFLFLELSYTEQALETVKDYRSFTKREMSRLLSANTPETNACLIRLCEGLIQFSLIREPNAEKVQVLNQFLPPGLSFSLVSGRLLFEPPHFFQPHNLFFQEQGHYYLEQDKLLSENPKESSTHAPDPSLDPETPRLLPEEAIHSPETQEHPPAKEADVSQRSQTFQSIRHRRLLLLKQWEK